MGDFVIEIRATGGHGCQRDKKDGEVVEGCGFENCPDCMVREFVKKFKDKGMLGFQTNYARLTHWPEGPGTVVDNLLTGVRKGSF
jgi:hypothetical protein